MFIPLIFCSNNDVGKEDDDAKGEDTIEVIAADGLLQGTMSSQLQDKPCWRNHLHAGDSGGAVALKDSRLGLKTTSGAGRWVVIARTGVPGLSTWYFDLWM